jgi:L-asparaginase II
VPEADLGSSERDRPVVLAEAVRSGFVESRHHGSLVVLDADGSTLVARGDVSTPVLPRSCNKLMQAVGLVELGYAERGELLALAASSHSGSPLHLEGVHRILASAGLDEHALRTPPDWPYDAAERDALLRAGGVPDPVLMNCSGKHAAMLAVCVARGWPLDDYRDPAHPLQQHLAGVVERMASESVGAVGVDGCGAPVSAISLAGVARAFSCAVQAAPGTAEHAVADAMRAHPMHVGGRGRDVTRLMQGVPGLLAKDGAEGVFAVALDDGRAVALKIEDGAARPRPVVVSAVLRHLGVRADVLDEYAEEALLGGGEPVGAVRAARGLLA